MGSIVQLEKISHVYGENKVFSNLDLAIAGRKITCIMGPTGSGKTTLLRLIAGFEIPKAGKIIISGNTATDGEKILMPPYKRRIGFVFQDLALWPHFTVYNHLSWVLKMQGVKNREVRTEEMLNKLELIDSRNKYPHQLSGGQQQLLAIARALISDPVIILMDEPFSGLDAELKDRMIGQLINYRDEFDSSIVYVTHHYDEAQKMSQDVFRLKKNPYGVTVFAAD